MVLPELQQPEEEDTEITIKSYTQGWFLSQLFWTISSFPKDFFFLFFFFFFLFSSSSNLDPLQPGSIKNHFPKALRYPMEVPSFIIHRQRQKGSDVGSLKCRPSAPCEIPAVAPLRSSSAFLELLSVWATAMTRTGTLQPCVTKIQVSRAGRFPGRSREEQVSWSRV